MPINIIFKGLSMKLFERMSILFNNSISKCNAKLSEIPSILSKVNVIERLLNNEYLIKTKYYIDTYINMLRDYYNKKYTEIPIGSITAIIFTITYLLSPVDVVPDVLPMGLLDDSFIIALCIKFTIGDIDKYVDYCNNITSQDVHEVSEKEVNG